MIDKAPEFLANDLISNFNLYLNFTEQYFKSNGRYWHHYYGKVVCSYIIIKLVLIILFNCFFLFFAPLLRLLDPVPHHYTLIDFMVRWVVLIKLIQKKVFIYNLTVLSGVCFIFQLFFSSLNTLFFNSHVNVYVKVTGI
jgi:hypothetical protein